jgi:hypothetical protein
VLTGLQSLTNYAINFWVKADSPAAGVLAADLYDPLATAVIADEAGTANATTVDLTTIGTVYVPVNFEVRLPEPVPATVKFRLHLTTALSNTKIACVDHLCLAAMEQADGNNPGGTPSVVVFNGSKDFSTDDGRPELTNVFKIVTANDRASLWQQLFDKFFDMSGLGLQLPYAGTTLINDSLIT